MAERLFTLAEAEALLPRLVPVLERMRDAHAAVEQREGEIATLLDRTRHNGHGVDVMALAAARAARDQALQALRVGAIELDALGIELKDPATGLIDFRSRFQGRVIYLCWRLGEPRIDWWHELEAGFAGRRRIDRLD